MWCIPPERNAEFVCAMENVLEVYHRRYDPKRPMVCMDETSKQLVKETRVPVSITNTSGTARRMCSCSANRWRVVGESR